MVCVMARCGPEHTDLEMTVQGAEYLDPSTPALAAPKSLSQKSPEHALWFGVLELAVREIVQSEHASLVRNALTWIAADTREFGDFLWITDHLMMPSEAMQSRLVMLGQARLRALTTPKPASSPAKSLSS